MLVDLPGYGFAKAPKTRDRALDRAHRRAISGAAPSLRRVLLLIDARHGLKDADRRCMKLLDEAAVSYQVVLTKADKVEAGRARRRARGDGGGARDATPPRIRQIHLTSAHDGTGIAELRARARPRWRRRAQAR